MTDVVLKVGFWDWALAAYGAPDVAQACLDLQDAHGQNVPLLLWAAWASGEGLRIESEAAAWAARTARHWSQSAIVPLRSLRRRLKMTISDGDDESRMALREAVKACELEAERILMQQLELQIATNAARGEASLAGNLITVAAAWSSQVPHEALRSLTEALTKAEKLGYTGVWRDE